MKYGIALTTAILFLAGCATTQKMTPTQQFPASTGEVKLKEKESNNELEIQVKHLPPPNYIDSYLSTYVVWLRPNAQESWNNIGQIDIDSDSRDGVLETTTSFTTFEVLVTAENDSTVTSPSEHVMLGTDFIDE